MLTPWPWEDPTVSPEERDRRYQAELDRTREESVRRFLSMLEHTLQKGKS